MGLVLALDLGTKCGYALGGVGYHNQVMMSGTNNFAPGRFEGAGMRYLRFTNWLDEVKKLAGGLASIQFEEVRRHAGVDAAHCYGGFLATLSAWCETNRTPYAGVPVGTIKKFATGRGNATKEMMLEAAVQWGFKPCDDNEADAIALLRFVVTRDAGS